MVANERNSAPGDAAPNQFGQAGAFVPAVKGFNGQVRRYTNQDEAFDALRALYPERRLPTATELAAIEERGRSGGTDWQWHYIPRRPPTGWRYVQMGDVGVAATRANGLRVIVDGLVKADGLRWLHVSVSRSKGLPTYADIAAAKRTFIGDDLFAYQVFAPPGKHVNLFEVLHLWACVDRPMYLPDMTEGFDTI